MTGETTIQAREWTQKTTDSFCATARVFVTSDGFQRPRHLGDAPREGELAAVTDPFTGMCRVGE